MKLRSSILDHAPMFGWHVMRLGVRIDAQQDMCSKEIGLHAQNLLPTLDSIINTIDRLGCS